VHRFLTLAAALFMAAPAHATYFGKNKVQYKKFDWSVLETPHFEIVFYAGADAVVHDAARMAERTYDHLSVLLGHRFTKRIPLILYASHSDFQQTNITESFIDIGTGGITELVRRRVFLPFTGSYAELEHVLQHELVHAFQIDILYDPDKSDAASPFAYSPPLWVMEGMAEHLSRGSGDSFTDMWVRDACLAGKLPTIEQLGWTNDIRVYRLGQSVWEFFGHEYGDDKIGDLLRTMRDRKSLDRALETVAKTTLGEFSDKWSMAMRRKHLPGIASRQTTREFAQACVTRQKADAWLLAAPNISPDGSQLAYVSDQSLSRDLWVRSLDGEARPRRLVQGDMSGDFEALRFFSASGAWSPDGRTLAFAAKTGGQDALYLVDVASGAIERKLAFGLDEVQTATFSPDGTELVFVGLAAGQSDLYRVRRDGSDLRRLTHDRAAERDPQWSPDGSRVAFVTDAGPETDFEALEFGRMHVALLDLATGATRDVTPFATGKAVSPAWSGNSESLAFVSDRDGTSNIYVLHLPTGQAFRLTDTTTGITGILPTGPALSWARTSDRLVFAAFGESGWDLYRIDAPSAALRPVECEPAEIVALDSAGADDTRLAARSTPEAEASDAVPAPAAAGATDSFRLRDYRPRLAPDLSSVGGVASFEAGLGGQSQLQFSDLLGNHHLGVGLGIYGSLKDSDLYLSYLNRSGRIAWSVSGFQFRKRYGVLGSRRSVEIEHQTYRGVQLAAIRPFDRFSRVEATLQAAGVAGRFFLGETADQAATDPGIREVRSFVGPGVAYVFDSSMWGTTGPIKGRRMRVSLDAALGQIHYATLEADMRHYWNLRKWYTIAGRVYAATSHGDTPQTLYLGGASTLRGYDYGALVGNHALLGSLEFRFPLVRHLGLGWPLPLEMGTIQGVLFGDAGTAWDGDAFRTSRAVRGEAIGRAPQASAGLGVRVGLGALVLKLDWARCWDTGAGVGSSGSNVALGYDF
jgi:Tol biopolymer transport system component